MWLYCMYEWQIFLSSCTFRNLYSLLLKMNLLRTQYVLFCKLLLLNKTVIYFPIAQNSLCSQNSHKLLWNALGRIAYSQEHFTIAWHNFGGANRVNYAQLENLVEFSMSRKTWIKIRSHNWSRLFLTIQNRANFSWVLKLFCCFTVLCDCWASCLTNKMKMICCHTHFPSAWQWLHVHHLCVFSWHNLSVFLCSGIYNLLRWKLL